MPKMNKYDRKHLSNIAEYQRRIDTLYREMVKEAALLGSQIGTIKGDSLFSFADYPTIRKRAETLLSTLQQGVYGVIVNGIDAEWTLANNKNSELARRVFGDNVGRLSQAQYRRYFSTNDTARKAFLARKEAGLNLSDRVWLYTDQFKTEIELGLDVGIRNGLSAAEMARDLRQYLRQPDRLFRRVRDEHGDLRPPKAYHSGQGVYRSSYKNARRLAATETNIAYRTADHDRWQQLDFVVGIRIVLSNNHTTRDGKGHIVPLTDICDELSAPLGFDPNDRVTGCYPKDFKFTGWHPQCRCHAVSILKTEEEIQEDTRRLLNGEDTTTDSVNTVTDVPPQFKEWIEDNAERSARTYSKPYFVTDNEKYIPDKLREAFGSKLPYPTFAEYEQAMKNNRDHAHFSPEQRKNIRELNAVMPVIQGQIMPFGMADNAHPNPHFGDLDAEILGYQHNCQTCTMAYELRRRGFDVTAKPNPIYRSYKRANIREMDVYYASHNTEWDRRFIGKDGKGITPAISSGLADTVEAKRLFLERQTVTTGRYEVYCQWKKGSAHVFILERQKNGNLLWYDPQSGEKAIFADRYLEAMKPTEIRIYRIDDALINPVYAKRFLKAKH